MDTNALKDRFKKFAIAIVRATEKFPKESVYFIVKDQIIRCSTSSASNYRAVCRAKSGRDFINKLKIVEEELDETLFWLEFTMDINSNLISLLEPLHLEGDELLRITVASLKTSRRNQSSKAKMAFSKKRI